MFVYIVSTLLAVIILYLGELLPNQTKETYVEQGHDWSKVLLYSNIAGILGGLLSTLVILITKMPASLNPQFLPFATAVTAYITVQSMMTDVKTLLINRNILRVAYLSMYAIALYNVTTNPLFLYNDIGLLLFTIVLVLLFFFSSIGASDVRAIAVALPFSVSIGGYVGIRLLILSLVVVTVYMVVSRHNAKKDMLEEFKTKYSDMYEELGEKDFKKISSKTINKEFKTDDKHAVAVGPFMIVPFLVYFLLFPILV